MAIQRNNYYPFGMSFGEESGEEQGKQLDKEHGLNQYDYAARFMDPSMVRSTSVTSKTYSLLLILRGKDTGRVLVYMKQMVQE